jgi:hypothetical protein
MTKQMESIVHIPGEGYFRLFPFVKDSRTHDIAQTPQQAFEAASNLDHLPGCLAIFRFRI